MTTTTQPRWNPNTLTKVVTSVFIGGMILSPVVADMIEKEAQARCYGPAFSAHCERILGK